MQVYKNCEFEPKSDEGHLTEQDKAKHAVEKFSFECRKEIDGARATPHDWLKKLAPLFHPIRSQTKTNRDSRTRVFPRFASTACNYSQF